jgi:hypothetical protein
MNVARIGLAPAFISCDCVRQREVSMSTIWKSTTKATTNSTFTGTTLSPWSRQQKLAMMAGFVILGILLGLSACSKQSAKPALVGVSGPAQTTAAPAATTTPTTTATASPTPVAPKKMHKKRPTVVTYSDINSGVAFIYPRKYGLVTGDKAQPQFADMGAAPMNFVQPGGVVVATVALPAASYRGTDFTSAFFNVNVNRSLSEQECSHFAFVDTRNVDGEPVDAEKVKVGSKDMEMTSDFSANAVKQAEAQYYHSYENGACYEFVLGLGTAGYGTADGVEPVDRGEVFKKLEKILTSVKIQPVEQEHVAEKTVANGELGK